MTEAGPQVRLEALRHDYRDGTQLHRVLDGINICFERSESVALQGASGSGKSTLLNLIAGIEPPVAGRIWVGDFEVSRFNERQRTLFRRRHIGFIYQFFNLIPGLTLLENIRLPQELNGTPSRQARQEARRMLQRVGLSSRAEAYPEAVSGGEQQRVAIARALVHRPDLILADEPTGSLDAITGRAILELLLEVTQQNGTTLLMVTHSTAVADAAQRRLRLANGHLEPA